MCMAIDNSLRQVQFISSAVFNAVLHYVNGSMPTLEVAMEAAMLYAVDVHMLACCMTQSCSCGLDTSVMLFHNLPAIVPQKSPRSASAMSVSA